MVAHKCSHNHALTGKMMERGGVCEREKGEDRDTKRCGKVLKIKAVTNGCSFGAREINETAPSELNEKDFWRKCSSRCNVALKN